MSTERRRRVVIVGDALLDRDLDGPVRRLSPDAPVPVVDDPRARTRPGGAALAAALVAADGHDVTLVTALGDDAAGRELAALLAERGVTVVDLGHAGRTPEKVRVRTAGRSLLRLDYGGDAGAVGPLPPAGPALLAQAAAVLVSDYGRGVARTPSVRAALRAVASRVPIVWDPHPRGPDPVPGVRLVTPNAAEAHHASIAGGAGQASPAGGSGQASPAGGAGRAGGGLDPRAGLAAAAAAAGRLRDRWAAAGVAVTLGPGGALFVGGDGTPLAVPAPLVDGGDPCGAGDRFAATATVALATGALPSEAVAQAVASASAFVAAGGAAAADELRPGGGEGTAAPEAVLLAQRVRSAGGTVVATGGCFDLLHAGHVGLLRAARALGDCLIVCLNSDRSVRRLKGPGRPLVGQTDRATVLQALGCVDAVTVFDEDTPEQVLATLRPHVWAKGGDYALSDLPEARLVASWGGQAVVLPYLAGRSTTLLIEGAMRRDG